jgi:hypothetical protein
MRMIWSFDRSFSVRHITGIQGMAQRPISIFMLDLPMKRSFQWRVFVVLVALYFLANIAAIPLLRKTDVPIEPVWFWGVATIVAALVIALSLALANRTGLGAPLFEGRLPKEDLPNWLRSGLALTMLMLMVGFPFSLIANLSADPATYPFGWELLGASFKAGVVEEILSRLFLVSLFVWLGGLFRRNAEGRPTRGVYWAAILLAALMFGWAHVDAQLSNPAATFEGYALIMMLSSILGIYFGWLFWKLGLEWAMFAHFAYDAFISMMVIPVYLLKSPILWFFLVTGLVVASVISFRFLIKQQQNA